MDFGLQIDRGDLGHLRAPGEVDLQAGRLSAAGAGWLRAGEPEPRGGLRVPPGPLGAAKGAGAGQDLPLAAVLGGVEWREVSTGCW